MNQAQENARLPELRTKLIQQLNESQLNGRAIMAFARAVSAVEIDPGQTLIKQHEKDPHIYFLLEGKIEVFLDEDGRERRLGERNAPSMIGEIAYFNKTPASATVKISNDAPGVLLSLSHKDFGDILEEFPDVRQNLARIGEMRIIAQYNGFVEYHMFMEMIGWLRDRFAINRGYAADVEDALKIKLLPLLNGQDKILEVGDGPGVVSELIHENRVDFLDILHLQVNDLQGAIYNPLVAKPSDLEKAFNLKESFQCIISLQVFNNLQTSQLTPQLELCHRLLKPGGYLVMIKASLLDVHYGQGTGDAYLIFGELERLLERTWPDKVSGHTVVETTFDDADLEPIMLWGPEFSKMAKDGQLPIPENVIPEERVVLEELLSQAKRGIFDPDALHFEWLALRANLAGFHLVANRENPENKFYFHIYQRMA